MDQTTSPILMKRTFASSLTFLGRIPSFAKRLCVNGASLIFQEITVERNRELL